MPDPRRPFDMPQAIFWLVAACLLLIIGSEGVAFYFCMQRDGSTETCRQLDLHGLLSEMIGIVILLFNVMKAPRE